jgi:UDP-N-acetylmuramoylalanine--D-glutamate ligase
MKVENSEPNLAGKKIVVMGMARSGLASARFLTQRGASVTVSEQKDEKSLTLGIKQLDEWGVAWEAGGHRIDTLLEADLVVVSPGVPLAIPVLRQVRQAGIELVSEIELAGRFLKGMVIGITGSNGKTTTTSLTGEILKRAGFHVLVGGNIGTPLISLAEQSRADTITVVELSSFQLEAIPTFRPRIAVLLNLTPDHLDRYASFEAYARAKLNIFLNQTSADFAILNLMDPWSSARASQLLAKVCWFSTSREVPYGCWYDGARLIWTQPGSRLDLLSRDEVQLQGLHNLENVAAAVSAAMLVEVDPAKIREGVKNFSGVEHRLEKVAEINGVTFFNDSKATNTDATVKALEAFPPGIILILGGRDKGSDYSVLLPLVREKVKKIILLGEAAGKIQSHLGECVPLQDAATLAEAVNLAYHSAASGEIVLLAPACASFDMFENFEQRGRIFKKEVFNLQRQVNEEAAGSF